jgi:hypothetical protein
MAHARGRRWIAPRDRSVAIYRGLVFPDLDRSRLKVYLMLSLFRFDGASGFMERASFSP